MKVGTQADYTLTRENGNLVMQHRGAGEVERLTGIGVGALIAASATTSPPATRSQ